MIAERRLRLLKNAGRAQEGSQIPIVAGGVYGDHGRWFRGRNPQDFSKIWRGWPWREACFPIHQPVKMTLLTIMIPRQSRGICKGGQSPRMPAAPSQAHRRSGICAGLLLTARPRRAFLFLATLKRSIAFPTYRHLKGEDSGVGGIPQI